MTQPKLPTFVFDLDHTLIKTDLSLEVLLRFLILRPQNIVKVAFWSLKGTHYVKEMLAQRVLVDIQFLPFDLKVLDFLQVKKALGHKVFLATGSNQLHADLIGEHLKLDGSFGSTAEVNLVGKNKAEKLVKLFPKGFIYVGDSKKDLEVWPHAESGVTVTKRFASSKVKYLEVERKWSLSSLFRVHQWTKNLLLFVPLTVSQKIFELNRMVDCSIGFLLFCITASAVYIINDLCDIDSDRRHLRKKLRPFASGQVSILSGLGFAFGLLGVSSLGVWFLLPQLADDLAVYFVITSIYSLKVKKYPILDVISLAFLYSLRVWAGYIAADLTPSPWLMAFSLLLFWSLALMKRAAELKVDSVPKGRGYQEGDLATLVSMGQSAGVGASCVLLIYVNSNHILNIYNNPKSLWLLMPIYLWWLGLAWLRTLRGQMNDDPIIYAIKDASTYVAGALILVALMWARGNF